MNLLPTGQNNLVWIGAIVGFLLISGVLTAVLSNKQSKLQKQVSNLKSELKTSNKRHETKLKSSIDELKKVAPEKNVSATVTKKTTTKDTKGGE